MEDEEIQKQIDAAIAYETKRQIVEGFHSYNDYFKVVHMPLEPKLTELNRFKEILDKKK